MTTDRESASHRPRRFAEFWVGTLDTRPLALMRVTFGVVLVLAVLDVGPVLRDLLTDEGVMPRAALLSGLARAARFSVFDAAGPTWVSWVLWMLTVLAASAFAVGFRTRAATALSFVLVTGLHERNLAVFDGSDNVIRVLLFFLMFAPAGDHYSLDALRRPIGAAPPPRSAFTTRLVEVQFAWVYLGSALGKLRGATWRSGTALHYALALEHSFTRRVGVMLSDVRGVVIPGTYATLAFEGAFVLLAFSPVLRKSTRAVAVSLGVALHAGIALTMRVGNFSALMIACYPLFLAPEWVDRIARFWQKKLRVEALGRLASTLGEARPGTLGHALPFRGAWRALLGTTLATAVWASCPRSSRVFFSAPPRWMQASVQMLELWQVWEMFAPDPARADFYLRGIGLLKDGTTVDVLHGLHGGPLPPAEPGFFFTRWTKFVANLAYSDPPALLPFGGFLCRRWNAGDVASPLMTFKIFREERATAPLSGAPGPWESKLIWDHHCY